jgi:hypothetical protein
MDFTKLETEKYYNVPQLLHFKHPVFGHLLYADGDEYGRKTDKSTKPVGLRAKHVLSASATKMTKDWRAGIITGDFSAAYWASLVSELVNFPEGMGVADLPSIFAKTPEFESQFDQFVGGAANFFEKPAA